MGQSNWLIAEKKKNKVGLLRHPAKANCSWIVGRGQTWKLALSLLDGWPLAHKSPKGTCRHGIWKPCALGIQLPTSHNSVCVEPSKNLLLKGGAIRHVMGYEITALWDFNSLQNPITRSVCVGTSKVPLIKGGPGKQVVGYGISSSWDFNSLQTPLTRFVEG
jgi:hypothetical protein